MAKRNLQIRLPEELDAQISQLAPHSKSDFVRQAIQEKVQRMLFQRLEDQWIQALKKNPTEKAEDESWLKAESWGSR